MLNLTPCVNKSTKFFNRNPRDFLANEEAMTIFTKSIGFIFNQLNNSFKIDELLQKSKLVISAMKTSKILRRKVKTFQILKNQLHVKTTLNRKMLKIKFLTK